MLGMKGNRVLVTGGAGFIGSALVNSLRRETKVRVLDARPGDDIPDDVEVIAGDVRNPEVVNRAVAGIDVVFHEAALVSVEESIERPVESHSINVTGTLNVLEAARDHDARVVVASSAAIYGDPETVPVAESAPLDPQSPYGVDKLAADKYTRLYNDLYGLETVALRYFNVYGPGQSGDYAGVIDVFTERARSGDPLPIHGDGEQTRDFVHVADVVEANRRAATTDAVGQAFNVGTGESVSVQEVATLIRRFTDSESPIVHESPREGDVEHSRADLTRAREILEYEPSIDFATGLESLLDTTDRKSRPMAPRTEN